MVEIAVLGLVALCTIGAIITELEYQAEEKQKITKK